LIIQGAYYYYNPDPQKKGNDYLAMLLEVSAYAKTQGIPYRGVLLDSWWCVAHPRARRTPALSISAYSGTSIPPKIYFQFSTIPPSSSPPHPPRCRYFKGVGDGVYNWTAMPSVFAGGNLGIREMVNQTGWQITAHNRYWSADTNYAKANGGDWDFYVDPKGQGNNMAVPLQQSFWEMLLSSSWTEWGTSGTYEQDWCVWVVDTLARVCSCGDLCCVRQHASLDSSAPHFPARPVGCLTWCVGNP
jgi:hypothetical protein